MVYCVVSCLCVCLLFFCWCVGWLVMLLFCSATSTQTHEQTSNTQRHKPTTHTTKKYMYIRKHVLDVCLLKLCVCLSCFVSCVCCCARCCLLYCFLVDWLLLGLLLAFWLVWMFVVVLYKYESNYTPPHQHTPRQNTIKKKTYTQTTTHKYIDTLACCTVCVLV